MEQTGDRFHLFDVDEHLPPSIPKPRGSSPHSRRAHVPMRVCRPVIDDLASCSQGDDRSITPSSTAGPMPLPRTSDRTRAPWRDGKSETVKAEVKAVTGK